MNRLVVCVLQQRCDHTHSVRETPLQIKLARCGGDCLYTHPFVRQTHRLIALSRPCNRKQPLRRTAHFCDGIACVLASTASALLWSGRHEPDSPGPPRTSDTSPRLSAAPAAPSRTFAKASRKIAAETGPVSIFPKPLTSFSSSLSWSEPTAWKAASTSRPGAIASARFRWASCSSRSFNESCSAWSSCTRAVLGLGGSGSAAPRSAAPPWVLPREPSVLTGSSAAPTSTGSHLSVNLTDPSVGDGVPRSCTPRPNDSELVRGAVSGPIAVVAFAAATSHSGSCSATAASSSGSSSESVCEDPSELLIADR